MWAPEPPLPVSLALSLRDALRDPYCWLGAAVGAAGVVSGVATVRLLWLCGQHLQEACEDEEAFYDALEDMPTAPSLADNLRLHVHTAMSPGRPNGRPLEAPAVADGALGLLRGVSLPRLAPEERQGPEPLPGEFHEASWSPGDARALRVRLGPGYLRTGAKAPSRPQLYDTVGVDVVTANCRIDEVVPRLCPLPQGGEAWHPGCGLPRVLVFNCQMPFESGPKLWGPHPESDHGVSVVCQFTASPELLRVASLAAPPKAEPILPAVRLLQRFVRQGTMDYTGDKRGAQSSGTLKLIGWVEELESVELPALLRPTVEKYNGKPVLLTGTGKIFQDPSGEWMEIDFDVRDFSWVTKSFLVNLRHKLKGISAQVAAVIQGTEDDELPEVVLATLRFHALDLLAGAWLHDPRAEAAC